MTPAIPLTRLGDPARIGLLSDTHCHGPGANDLPGNVLGALRAVDLIVHLGDIGDVAVLDRLANVADVVATRGRDDPAEDPRLSSSARVIEAGGLVVGALFDLAEAGLAAWSGDRLEFGDRFSPEAMQRVFGRRVDVVAFGATHRAILAHHRGVLFVNPGSPALPAEGASRTVATLDLRSGTATVEIVRAPSAA